MMETLRKGCLAYIDSFSGLVPCKVLSVRAGEHSYSSAIAKVQVTSKRFAGYPFGSTHEFSTSSVIPRRAIHTRNFKFSIRPYNVEIDKQ